MILTGEQIRAARALVRLEQTEIAHRSGVSVDTIKRLERFHGEVSANIQTVAAVQRALEEAWVEFLPENGAGASVRLRKPSQA